MAEMKARITLDSNGYTSSVKQVIDDTDNMINTVNKAKESILQIGKLKASAFIEASTTKAQQDINKLRENIDNIKKNVSILIQAKDSASTAISKIGKSASDLIKTNYKLEIGAIDKTKSVITGIKDSIFNLKTLAASIVLGVAGKEAFNLTLGNAMSNEQYLSTLQTVLHSNQAGNSALKWSYKEAASTPFDASEVVAGVTQLVTSGLDFKKYLEPLGDAAAAFNKPLEQAIFAMGKLKSGQLGMGVDMLRDFGISNTDWMKTGATFSKSGELQGLTGDQATELALKMIQSKYGGLMDKQSSTAKGMISNIGDTINGMGRGLAGIDSEGQIMKGGLFDNFKQQLQTIMPLLDRVQNSNAFKELQKDIGNLATLGGQRLTVFLKSFDSPEKVTQYKNEFKQFIADVKAGVEVAKDFSKAIGTIGTAVEPLVKLIIAHPKLFVGLFAGIEVTKGAVTMISAINIVTKELPYLSTAIGVFGLSAQEKFVAIGASIKTFATAIAESTVATKLATSAQWLFDIALNANPIGLIVLGIAAFIGALYALYKAYENNFLGIKTKLAPTIEAVKKIFGELRQNCEEEMAKIEENIKTWWESTRKTINSNPLVIKVKKEVSQEITQVRKGASNAYSFTKDQVGDIWQGIEQGNVEQVILKKLGTIKKIIWDWAQQQNKENIKQFSQWGSEIGKWFEDIAKSIPQHLIKWGSSLSNGFTSLGKNISKGVTNWGNSVYQWFETEKKEIPKRLSNWGTSMVTGFVNLKKNVVKGIENWGTSVVTGFTNLKKDVVKGIESWGSSMVTGFSNLKKNAIKTIMTWKDDFLKWFKNLGVQSTNTFTTSFNDNLAKGKPSTMDKLGKIMLDILKYTLALLAIAAVALAREIIKELLESIAQAGKNMYKAGQEFVEWFKKGANEKIAEFKKDWDNTIGYFLNHPLKATMDIIQRITGSGNKTGNNALGTTYWRGGLTYINEHGMELIDLPAGSKIHSNRESNNMMKNMQLPNGSMAPEAAKWGQDIPEGMAKGIKANTKSVTDATTFMASKIKELIHFSVPDKGPLSDFDTYAVDMMKTYGTGIQNNIKSVTTPTTNMSTGVKNIYTDLKTQSLTYGQGIVQELGTGIQSNVSNLTSIVKTLTDKVIEQFKSGFGVHSPSVVMYKIGTHLMEGLVNGMTSKDMEGFVTNWIGSLTSAAGGAVSGNLSGWITAAMALTGVGADWFSPLATLIQHESGGDPMSINLWDWNAQMGHPSKGLMQLIDENMQDWHLPGMDNVYDPVSNIAAGIRLIQHDYGSIFNTLGIKALASGGSYVGYAQGGIATQPSIFGEGDHPEMAIPLKKDNSRSKYLLEQADALINGEKKSGITIIIPKLADQIIVREESDIDKIATALAKKLTIAEMNI